MADAGSVVDLEAQGRLPTPVPETEPSCGIAHAACGPRIGHAVGVCLGSVDAHATEWGRARGDPGPPSTDGRIARVAILACLVLFFWWAASTAPLWASTRRPAINPRIPG